MPNDENEKIIPWDKWVKFHLFELAISIILALLIITAIYFNYDSILAAIKSLVNYIHNIANNLTIILSILIITISLILAGPRIRKKMFEFSSENDTIALSFICIQYRMVGIFKWAGRLWRWSSKGWRILVIHLIAIIAVIMVLSSVLGPLDPAGLDYRFGEINGSSMTQPTLDNIIENVRSIFADEDAFSAKFRNETNFNEILSNDTIFNRTLENNSLFENYSSRYDYGQFYENIWGNFSSALDDANIIETLLMNQSIGRFLKNQTLCKKIYCNKDKSCDWCADIAVSDNHSNITDQRLNASIISSRIADVSVNRNKTLEYLFQNTSLEESSIKLVYDNRTLRKIAYLRLIEGNDGAKNSVIAALRSNSSLINESLAVVFADKKSMAIVSLIISNDKSLQKRLFEPTSSPLNRLISLLWNYWAQILILWIILEILIWGTRLNRSLAISDFVDESNDIADATKKPLAKGLGPQLLARLNWLYRLYAQVDERRSISTVAVTDIPLSAAIKSEEAVNILSSGEILDATTKLPLGLLSIPQKLINDLAGFLFKRPTITGTLHKTIIYGDDKDVKPTSSVDSKDVKTAANAESKEIKFLTARMVSQDRSLSWRVEGVDDSIAPWEEMYGQSRTKTPEEMVDELAHQIFADLAFKESRIVSWKSIRYFGEGLRMYRRCLRNEMDKQIMLDKAEKRFLQAISEDQEFAWAYYNLGVVYTEMKEAHAAHDAFLKAQTISPDSWQIHYALARNEYLMIEEKIREDPQNISDYFKKPLNQVEKEKIDTLLGHCRDALDLCTDSSARCRIWELNGLVYKSQCENGKKKEAFRKASFFALCALWNAYLREDDPVDDRLEAKKCLSYLAKYCYLKDSDERIVLKDMAESLVRDSKELQYTAVVGDEHSIDPEVLRKFGNKYWHNDEYEMAKEHYLRAMMLKPDVQALRYNMGVVYLSESENFSRKDQILEHLKKGNEFFEQALVLTKDDIEKIKIHFWLGILLQEYRNFDKAIFHLKSSLALAEHMLKRDKYSEYLNEEWTNLEKEVTNLEKEMATKQEMIKKMEVKRDELGRERAPSDGRRLEEKKNNLDEEICMLNEWIDVLKEENKNLDVYVGKLNGEKTKLEDEMKNGPKKKIDELENEKKAIQAEKEKLAKMGITSEAGKKNSEEMMNYFDLDKENILNDVITTISGEINEIKKLDSKTPNLEPKDRLEEKNKLEQAGWLINLKLGEVHLEQRKYDDCENELSSLLDNRLLRVCLLVEPSQKICEIFDYDEFPVGELVASARLGLASSYLRKGANLNEAEKCIDCAKYTCSKIKDPKIDLRDLKSSIYKCKGWLKYIQVQKGEVDLNYFETLPIYPAMRMDRATVENSALVLDDGNYKLNGGKIKEAIIWIGEEQSIEVIEAEIQEVNIKKGAKVKGKVGNNELIEDEHLLKTIPPKVHIIKANFDDAKLLSGYLKNVSFRNRASVSKGTDKGESVLFIRNLSPSITTSLRGIDEAIRYFEIAISIKADTEACLRLAQAMEFKLGLISDARIKESITRQIKDRCRLAKQLDVMEVYTTEIDEILKRYQEKKDKDKTSESKTDPSSTLSLSIEGTAKGEIASKPVSKEDATKKP
jgi:tetratricopeptide (TPR) repeat protein